MLEFVPECCKNQNMRDKAVNAYPSTIKNFSGCFMTQEKCEKEVNRCLIVFDSIPDWYKTREMCVSKDCFLIVLCPDKYKTQKMCEEDVDDSLAALVCYK